MTLFVVQAPSGEDADLLRARFVADRFSWPAFVFAWARLLYHRLWLAFLVWAVLEGLLLAFALPHLAMGTAFGVDLLARIFLGLEASRLRLGKGARRAGLTELVEARDRDEAEAIFYARQRP